MILGLAVCAVLAGARSFTAIAEWAADADEQTLAELGVSGAVPSESTFRRTLQRLDADAFDDREDVGSASGPASPVSTWRGRMVGGLGPGLTSESADAARAVLRIDLSAPGSAVNPGSGPHSGLNRQVSGLWGAQSRRNT